MHVCIYIYIYIHVYVYIYIYIYTHDVHLGELHRVAEDQPVLADMYMC